MGDETSTQQKNEELPAKIANCFSKCVVNVCVCDVNDTH